MARTVFGPDGRRTGGPVPADATSAAISQFRAVAALRVRIAQEEARLDYMLARVPGDGMDAYVEATTLIDSQAADKIAGIETRRETARRAARKAVTAHG